jgi:hypothetical protein
MTEGGDMANVHRREVLLGFVAGAVGAPLAGAPSAAAERTEPPGDGPLSVKEVGSLLGQHNVPGASLAIIQNGEIVATYGYGVAQPNRPVTPRTRFQAASISKTFNALGARGAQAGRSERVPPRRSGQSTTPVVETSRQCAHRADACYHPYALEPYRRHQHARVRGLSAWCAVADPDRDPEWQSKGIGLETTRQALEAGHMVRAFARSAADISISDPKLEKVRGKQTSPTFSCGRLKIVPMSARRPCWCIEPKKPAAPP